ncbi:hypothetical protein GCM10017788_56080 [Amycolatopsis acidiphila]|nr:hypothetical protein GCM10017788_56080 [Amycolatopsis acidiphila]
MLGHRVDEPAERRERIGLLVGGTLRFVGCLGHHAQDHLVQQHDTYSGVMFNGPDQPSEELAERTIAASVPAS